MNPRGPSADWLIIDDPPPSGRRPDFRSGLIMPGAYGLMSPWTHDDLYERLTNKEPAVAIVYAAPNDAQNHPNAEDAQVTFARVADSLLVEVLPRRCVVVPNSDLPELLLRMALEAGLDLNMVVRHFTAPDAELAPTPVGSFAQVTAPDLTSLPRDISQSDMWDVQPGEPHATVAVSIELPAGTRYAIGGRTFHSSVGLSAGSVLSNPAVLEETLIGLVRRGVAEVGEPILVVPPAPTGTVQTIHITGPADAADVAARVKDSLTGDAPRRCCMDTNPADSGEMAAEEAGDDRSAV